jgi:hypothetical protein
VGSILTQPRGLLTLTDRLLTQVEPADAVGLCAAAGGSGGGLVVSGSQAMQVACYLRDKGYRAPLLVDRQRYKGKRRGPAQAQFDADWIARQRRLGLPAILPDAGYIAEGDLEGLRSILSRSAAIPGAVALLAVANWWLYGPGLRLLLGEVVPAGVPVALVIEHADDPLGVRRVLRGVVELLRAGVSVLPLRCDVSALGLLAHGALAAAYGSASSLRHLYPIKDGGGGGSAPESAVWPAGLALHYRDVLYDAVSATPADRRWTCTCPTCAGARMDHLAMADVATVRAHNTASLLDLRRTLVTATAGHGRVRLWSRWCAQGVATHEEVSLGPVVLTAPPAQRYWQQI